MRHRAGTPSDNALSRSFAPRAIAPGRKLHLWPVIDVMAFLTGEMLMKKIGMVQVHMPEGNTFQAGSMATNTHNSLSKRELWRKWPLMGFRKVLPCSEPCQKIEKMKRINPRHIETLCSHI